MIVKRDKLTLWERLYLPALLGGFKVTGRHFINTLFRGQTAAKQTAGGYYPETPWTVAEGYRKRVLMKCRPVTLKPPSSAGR